MIEIQTIKHKIFGGHLINKEEALELLSIDDKQLLYDLADEIRAHFCGNVMELCSITNAKSGNCPQDCKWCSQSIYHETDIDIYQVIEKQKARAHAVYNDNKGVNRMSLVTSGRRATTKDLERMVDLYQDIQEHTKLKLCASMGLLDKEQLELLQENGVSTYHCNLETSRRFFPSVCTTHTYDDKINTIRHAQRIGMDICSGGIIGMGESMEDRIDMALTLQELGIKSIPINLLSTVEGTALEPQQPLSEQEILTTFAMVRITNPEASVRFAAGRILISKFQHKALKAGVNSAIVGDLLTTIGTSVEEDKDIFKAAGYELINNEGKSI